ncbi:MAG: nucleotidyltransferase family protein [Caulobacteraceae bacterium]
MRALLLAAGLGSRLRPLTDHTPKCLAPIHGRPLLAYWLDALFADGRISRVLVNTHHLHEQVEAFVATSRWRDRIDLVHEVELLGTGGTILANRAWFDGESFLVVHADNLTDFALSPLIDAHAAAGPDNLMTLLAFRTPNPSQCGILELDSGSRVVAFHEKVPDPPGDLANGAVYVFSPDVVGRIAALGRPVVDLSTEIIPSLLPRVYALEHEGFFMDIGTPEALKQAQETFPPPPSGA